MTLPLRWQALRHWLHTHALQTSVVLGVAIALTVPAIFGSLFELQQGRQQAQDQLQTDTDRLADVLAVALRNPLWELSIPTAESIVRAMALDERIVSIVVTDAATRQPFVALHKMAGQVPGTVIMQKNILRGERMIGTVDIVMTIEPYLVQSRDKFRRNLFQLAAILLIAMTIIIWMLRRNLLRPLRSLKDEARRLADEQLLLPINFTSGNELGQVAGAMEHMRQRLLASFDELQEQHRHALEIIQASPVPLALNNGKDQIVFLNQAFIHTFGYTDKEIHTAADWRHLAFPDAQYRHWVVSQWKARMTHARETGTSFEPLEVDIACLDDTVRTTICSANPIEDNFSGRHLIVMYDITERKKSEEKIQTLAFFDQLTGLPNRTLLLDRLHQAQVASDRNRSHGAVLFIDLDHFKVLNDTLGHDVGDQLLKEVARRLLTCVRDGDTVARLGGDEFVVMLTGLDEAADAAANHAEDIGEKILATLAQTYRLKNIEYPGAASIGCTLFLGRNTDIEELLKQADMSMYKAKESGRNALRFFDPAMQAAVVARSLLDANLRTALAEAQFLLHFQAQVLDDGRVTGAEVLLRWPHPERGMISPTVFIPLAEETGLILPIGEWVLEGACRQLVSWAKNPALNRLSLAVNVSARQFRQDNFAEQVIAILARTGANPQRLKLELTESLLITDVDAIIEKMFMLKARGVSFSLDDFGTGYSSLSYLKRLPLDQLKIDQSFVRDILVDPNDAAIANTVVALARSLGLGVIAEGVETEAQREFLAHSGCRAYQGYLFSRPVPVDDFVHFVAAQTSGRHTL